MKFIDLSQEIYDKMPVYPGDPAVEIRQVHFLARQGWNLRTMLVTTHQATHVNVPAHMVEGGKSVDDYKVEDFMGKARVFTGRESVEPGVGLIFVEGNISAEIVEWLTEDKPAFVGLWEKFEFDIELERKLLAAGIISYENLVNCDKLPKASDFEFWGLPLKIRGADGSPVRAVAFV